MTAAELARALKAKRMSGGWCARCPAHDDRRASLSIGEGEDGRLLLHCHAGCDFEAILKAAGVEATKPNGEDRSKPQIVATYDYRDARGNIAFQVVRLQPKAFRQRRPNGSAWIWDMNGVERVPYRLPQLLNANEIYICEGERDCDNLAKAGLTATTNPGGAGKWPDSFSRWFRGRHAIILPDADQPGRQHAVDVARKLRGHAASVRIIELPGLKPKGDVSDWLAAGGTPIDLEDLAHATPSWTDKDPEPFGQADGQTTAKTTPRSSGVTEDDLATEFTRRHRDHLRYVALWGAWMRWSGRHWQRETTLEAFDLARDVCRDAADKIKNAKLRARLLSASTRAAVENLARSDRAHATTTEQWDRDPFALNEPGENA
jgi:putative DNA primase/helicase